MKLLQHVATSWAGRSAAVLCGGPSLPSAIGQIPLGAGLISANAHGCQLLKCDYIVAVDRVHTVTKQDMATLMRQHKTPIISPLFYADYRITDWDNWWNSGFHAIWAAWALGACPIIVAGMDCYTGATYFHTERYPSSGHDKTPDFFLAAARDLSAQIPGAQVRVVGDGPLTNVWPRYRASEQFEHVLSPEQRALADVPRIVRVRARETHHLWKNQTFPNFVRDVTESEARGLLAKGWVDVVPDPLTARISRGNRGQGDN